MNKISWALVALLLTVGVSGAQIGDHVWVPRTDGELNVIDSSGVLVTMYASPSTITSSNQIALNDSGEAYVAMQSQGVHHVNASGSVNTFYTPGGQPYAIAVAPTGDVWIGDGQAATVRVMTSTGGVQATISLGSGFIRSIATSTADVWVLSSNNNVYQFTTGGTIVRTITTGGSSVDTLAVDKNNHCWTADTTANLVTQYDRANGNTLTTMAVSGARDILFNAASEMYVCGTGGIFYYDGQQSLITSVAGGCGIGAALDGNGDVWVQDGTTQTNLRKHHRHSLALLQTRTWPAGPTLRIRGDATGYVNANIMNGSQDADSDQATNAAELTAGSNPFNPQSTPMNPQPIFHQPVQINQTNRFSARQASDANLGFAIGGSLGNSSQNYILIPGTNYVIPLENDDFYQFVMGNFWVFQNFGGFLDSNGEAIADINLPNDSNLVGTTWYFAFITLDNNNAQPVTTVSNNIAVTVQP